MLVKEPIYAESEILEELSMTVKSLIPFFEVFLILNNSRIEVKDE
jgi:hypothetical protein